MVSWWPFVTGLIDGLIKNNNNFLTWGYRGWNKKGMLLLISCRLATHPHVKTLGAIFVQQSHQRTLLLSTQEDLLRAADWKLTTSVQPLASTDSPPCLISLPMCMSFSFQDCWAKLRLTWITCRLTTEKPQGGKGSTGLRGCQKHQ